MIGRLQRAVVTRTLQPLIEQLLRESGVAAEQIMSLVIAGNTTMLHLFAGIDPSAMGMVPFTPQFLEHRVLRLADLPLRVQSRSAHGRTSPILRRRNPRHPPPEPAAQPNPRNPAVHLLPGAAAYVGADVIAGVFASGMVYQSETSLLVDVGTNGEIVLKHGERFWGCATAAGPAFEGSGSKLRDAGRTRRDQPHSPGARTRPRPKSK